MFGSVLGSRKVMRPMMADSAPTRRYARLAAAAMAGATALQPVAAAVAPHPAAADWGCNSGDATTYVTISSGHAYRNSWWEAWRFKATLLGSPYSYSRLYVGARDSPAMLFEATFHHAAGMYDAGHFGEIAGDFHVGNFIGLTKQYELKRSCRK